MPSTGSGPVGIASESGWGVRLCASARSRGAAGAATAADPGRTCRRRRGNCPEELGNHADQPEHGEQQRRRSRDQQQFNGEQPARDRAGGAGRRPCIALAQGRARRGIRIVHRRRRAGAGANLSRATMAAQAVTMVQPAGRSGQGGERMAATDERAPWPGVSIGPRCRRPRAPRDRTNRTAHARRRCSREGGPAARTPRR